MSTLYVVATPLGNRGDFTDRGKEILQRVDYIFAEDTREVRKLLSLYELKTNAKVISYHAKSTDSKEGSILQLLKEEITAALVTDAGTPAISDPGAHLIKQIREQIPECKIYPVPGASAITALLSVAGLDNHRFSFWGFVPLKKGRQTFLQGVASAPEPIVFYESVHRIVKTLEALASIVPEKKVVVGREMTKHFEEYPAGNLYTIWKYYESNPDKVRGEFALVVFP